MQVESKQSVTSAEFLHDGQVLASAGRFAVIAFSMFPYRQEHRRGYGMLSTLWSMECMNACNTADGFTATGAEVLWNN